MAKLNSRNGAVGYKRPPAHTRFAKGRSGNPKGRPNGSRAGNTLADLMNQTITVTMDGAPRKVPLTEALAISLFQRALAGNVPAAREAMKIMEKVEAQQNAASEEKPVQYVFRFAEPEMKDCNTALEKLNVIKPVAREYRIATWVVEAALARDNQLLREESNRRLIEVNMLNRDVLETILPKAA